MKKSFFCLLIFFSSSIVNAQNVFPSSGKVGIGTSSPIYNLDVIDSSSVIYAPGIAGPAVPTGTSVHISNTKPANSTGAFVYMVSANGSLVNQVGYMGVVSTPGSGYSPDFVFGQRTAGNMYSERLRISSAGNVGIGIIPSGAKLMAAGLIHTTTVSGGLRFDSRQGDFHDYQWYSSGGNALLYDHNDATNRIAITPNGNVGIGTTTPGQHRLAVEGSIGARKVKVQQGTWADHVFAPDYNLPSLQEVEKYILEHRHLQHIPSEQEVKENGLDLDEMNSKLLQKIEELTLYLIAQQKINDQQSKRIEQLEQLITEKNNH